MKYLATLLVFAAVSTTAYADRYDAYRAATRLADTIELIAYDASEAGRRASADGEHTEARRFDRYAWISHQIIGTLQGRVIYALDGGIDMRSIRMRYARMRPKFAEWNDAYVDLAGAPSRIRQRVYLAKRLYAQVREELYD